MGGKSKPDNSAVVQEQQQEAAAEAAKEAARQQRIQTGLASIKAAFHGSPTYTTQAFDWSKFKPTTNTAEQQYESSNPSFAASPHADLYTDPSLPAGYTIKKVPGSALTGATGSKSAAAPSSYVDTNNTAPQYRTAAAPSRDMSVTAAGASPSGKTADTWQVVGPDGTVHNPGDKFDVQTPDGGTTGGFDDAFYNKYKQSVLDYYMPQVDKQYSDAKKQATYGLARSGNLLSSAANTLTADLATQNDVNTAGVRNQADTAAGDLRSQVNTEEQKATSQLYATEDPEVASQQSLAAVRDISLQQPQMSPLSALFNVATIGGANVLKGYQGQQALNSFNNALPKSTGHVVNT